MKGSDASAFSRRQTSMPSSFGIITSSRIRSGRCSRARRQRLLAVGRGDDLVAWVASRVRRMSTVVRVVVDDQDARRRRARSASSGSSYEMLADLRQQLRAG